MATESKEDTAFRPEDYVPPELCSLEDPQTAIPAIAKDRRLLSLIDEAVQAVPTNHDLNRTVERTGEEWALSGRTGLQ